MCNLRYNKILLFTEQLISDQHTIRFTDPGHVERGSPIELQGVPFIIVGHKLLECHQGPTHNRNKAAKEVPSFIK